MKTVSVISTCYNEEGNVRAAAERVKAVFAGLPGYDYEHVFADNCSTDRTLEILREMAREDARVRVIANAKNFGQPRSLFNAILAANGDAVVVLAADLQDPPELIPRFVEEWEKGFQVVFGIRSKRDEAWLMTAARSLYYRLLQKVSEDELINDAGDFVLFDRNVLEVLRRVRDLNPYLRGLLTSLGFSRTGVPYHMAARASGKSTNNLFSLFVYGLNGFINHTVYPLRLATLVGFSMSLVSFVASFIYLLTKLVSWSGPPPGIPTILVALFFLSGVQLFLLGFLGELVGAIFRESKNLPLVVERERINFPADKTHGE